MLVLRGEGKNFCAGADLGWMKQSVQLNAARNREETKRLSELFELLFRVPMPTIALCQGAIYGGAVGMTACCDIVVADEEATFCLSEIKWGLVPAVVFPYLNLRVARGVLTRLVLTTRPVAAAEAREAGLVQVVAKAADTKRVIDEELRRLLEGEPRAQRAFKRYQRQISCGTDTQWNRTRTVMARLLAETRSAGTAQLGLSAFLDHGPAPWTLQWPPGGADAPATSTASK